MQMKSCILSALALVIGNLSFGIPDPLQRSQLRILETDDYNQWEEAKNAKIGTDPANFYKLPGFEVELLRSAEEDEGSWISCVFDPQGKLSIGREDSGILRYTFSKDRMQIVKKEWLLKQAKECRGLLYAHGALFVNANKSKILYRFKDTNGDNQFDEEKELFETPGGLGHGRNGLALGPNGLIYAIMGDSVKLPLHIPNIRDHTSPLRRKQKYFRPNEGHVLRFDKNGRNPAIYAAGLRNPYGIDFNADGEAFTFDADAEFDMGSPWYRPTQIKHITSGADFGWRAVTGSWPPYYLDHPTNTPACVNIGKASPTGILAGYKSRFPQQYRNAIFALDWTYGRILTIHLTPDGASYTGRPEVFLRGRPLNVTDADFGPDGAMYFVTGGRSTQSALYRVTYTGRTIMSPEKTNQEKLGEKVARSCRKILHNLERYHQAWVGKLELPTNLEDPRIRHATRIALEHQLAETGNVDSNFEPDSKLLALAQAYAGIHAISTVNNHTPTHEQLHIWRLILPDLSEEEKNTLREKLRQHPNADPRIATEIRIALEMPEATTDGMARLRNANSQQEQMHYLYLLRNARNGWSHQLRKEYFQHLKSAREYLGGRGLPGFISKIKKDAISSLTEAERNSLKGLLNEETQPTLPSIPDLSHRRFIRAWQMQDFSGNMQVSTRKAKLGKKLFDEGLCSRCHRFNSHGFSLGPDLTHVGSRLGKRDLLQAILEPSKAVAENYQTQVFDLHDGRQLSGQVIPQSDYRSRELLLATNPLEPEQVVKIPKALIKAYRQATTSTMPPGLLNTFTKEEVLALIEWLQRDSGDHPHPKPSRDN